MAKLYITEFVTPGVAHGGVVPVGHAAGWRENASSPLAITAASTVSVAFATNTSLVRLHADATCSVNIGVVGTTATVSNARMIQNQTEYYAVMPSQAVAVITNT